MALLVTQSFVSFTLKEADRSARLLSLYSDARVANRDIRVKARRSCCCAAVRCTATPACPCWRCARLRDSVRPLRPCGFQPSVASPPYRFREGRRISSRTQQRHASREPTWRVPSRAVGKLFVVPAGALPVPVSDRQKEQYRPVKGLSSVNRQIFSGPKPDLLPAKAVLLPSQGRQHNCFPSAL